MRNLYFELTEEFNADGVIAALSSGQAVVYYRLSLMSKDGDWVLRETPEACRKVLEVLQRHGARYRPSVPLDIRWLAGGWSSHFEFADPEGRRIRCDFVTRPPRVTPEALAPLFVPQETGGTLRVVGVESLIRMKQTQRAKDYPVIGELARLLPPEQEIELTTDPDRILALAVDYGKRSSRAPVGAALAESSREAVVVELARESDRLQRRDRARLEAYKVAAERYLREFQAANLGALELPEAHRRACELAEHWLPRNPFDSGD